MLNLISCELLKLKRSKMVLISVAGVLSTPLLMLIEALQTHFDKPEIIFTLSDIYSDSVLYIMLLVNIMIPPNPHCDFNHVNLLWFVIHSHRKLE